MRTLGVSRTAAVRSAGYLLLSRFFRYPEDEHPAETVRNLLVDALPAWRMLAPQLVHPDMETVRIEHRDLFFKRIHPLESAYVCQDPMSRDTLRKEITDCLESFQVQIQEADGPVDGVSSELAFMAFLTFKEGASWGENQRGAALIYREAQRKFLLNHLGRWYASFARDLGILTKNPFFLSAGQFLVGFVGHDMKEELRLNPEGSGKGASS